ncbi:hypothetical protein MTO96_017868 [Rhipicephalus appendiculatus]
MGASRKGALWKEVTAALNALGPVVKTAKLWRKYWSRLCYDSRKLARDIQKGEEVTSCLQQTGGRILTFLYAFAGGRGEEGSEVSRAGSWRFWTRRGPTPRRSGISTVKIRTTEHQGLQRQPLLSPSRCGPPQYRSLLHPCSLQQHRSLPQQPTSLWGASRAPAALHVMHFHSSCNKNYLKQLQTFVL